MNEKQQARFDEMLEELSTGKRDILIHDFEARMGLTAGEWDWSDIEAMLEIGETTLSEIKTNIWRGLS